MKEIFKSLTKHQHGVMEVLCSIQNPRIAAANLKPATLGSLCAKKLVNVDDGMVSSTCVMLWNMTFHEEMFEVISQKCLDDMIMAVVVGHRIAAIQTLRETTGWNIHEAKTWLDINLPK